MRVRPVRSYGSFDSPCERGTGPIGVIRSNSITLAFPSDRNTTRMAPAPSMLAQCLSDSPAAIFTSPSGMLRSGGITSDFRSALTHERSNLRFGSPSLNRIVPCFELRLIFRHRRVRWEWTTTAARQYEQGGKSQCDNTCSKHHILLVCIHRSEMPLPDYAPEASSIVTICCTWSGSLKTRRAAR